MEKGGKLIRLQDVLAEKREALMREQARERGYVYEPQPDGSYMRVPYHGPEARK